MVVSVWLLKHIFLLEVWEEGRGGMVRREGRSKEGRGGAWWPSYQT